MFLWAMHRASGQAHTHHVAMALVYTLPRAVGNQRAKELMYTARSVSAEEARLRVSCLRFTPMRRWPTR